VTIRKIDKRAAPLSGREVIGFLFADLYEQSGDKIAAHTTLLIIVAGLLNCWLNRAVIGRSWPTAAINGSEFRAQTMTDFWPRPEPASMDGALAAVDPKAN
jgi:hypothetical protein